MQLKGSRHTCGEGGGEEEESKTMGLNKRRPNRCVANSPKRGARILVVVGEGAFGMGQSEYVAENLYSSVLLITTIIQISAHAF